MNGISIIITYYKGEKFIFNCIDSILKSYEESCKLMRYEIILIIDSLEDSLEIRDRLKQEYGSSINESLNIIINPINMGVAKSRNIGLQHSKYRYFTIIDQDDYIEKNYFSVVEKEINGEYALYLINGYIKYINLGKSIPIYFFKPRFDFKSILLKNTYIYTPGLVIFDSNILEKSNFFIDVSEKYKGCDDWAAYLNILFNRKDIKYKYIKEKLFVYCLHSANYSNNISEMIDSSRSVLFHLKRLIVSDLTFQKDIDFSLKMQDFYFSKDFKKLNKLNLALKYPKQFLWHYFFSFFYLDRQNRLIFNLKKSIL